MPGGATGIRGQLRPKLGKCRKRWKAGWPYEAIALRRLSGYAQREAPKGSRGLTLSLSKVALLPECMSELARAQRHRFVSARPPPRADSDFLKGCSCAPAVASASSTDQQAVEKARGEIRDSGHGPWSCKKFSRRGNPGKAQQTSSLGAQSRGGHALPWSGCISARSSDDPRLFTTLIPLAFRTYARLGYKRTHAGIRRYTTPTAIACRHHSSLPCCPSELCPRLNARSTGARVQAAAAAEPDQPPPMKPLRSNARDPSAARRLQPAPGRLARYPDRDRRHRGHAEESHPEVARPHSAAMTTRTNATSLLGQLQRNKLRQRPRRWQPKARRSAPLWPNSLPPRPAEPTSLPRA
ncbi:hypothetical protein L1887_54080 [Cichorium endivia]|nr:hypothetical protein L1887_54080 [Cichorium endivia]